MVSAARAPRGPSSVPDLARPPRAAVAPRERAGELTVVLERRPLSASIQTCERGREGAGQLVLGASEGHPTLTELRRPREPARSAQPREREKGDARIPVGVEQAQGSNRARVSSTRQGRAGDRSRPSIGPLRLVVAAAARRGQGERWSAQPGSCRPGAGPCTARMVQRGRGRRGEEGAGDKSQVVGSVDASARARGGRTLWRRLACACAGERP